MQNQVPHHASNHLTLDVGAIRSGRLICSNCLLRRTVPSIYYLGSEKVIAAAADGGVDLAAVCGYNGVWDVCPLLHVEQSDTIAIRVSGAAERVSKLLAKGQEEEHT